MNKFFFTFDKTAKAQNLKKKLFKKYSNSPINKADAIIVGGGDGFMLQTLKKYVKFKKSFFGINCGSFGFLMNENKEFDLIKRVNYSKKLFLNPLEITIKNKKKIKKILAINELSIFRQSKQTASLCVKINKRVILKKLIGDGLIVCTPAGSTAYNLSVNGPILSLNSSQLAITPISPFRPRRWKGKTIKKNKTISIINLDTKKRPIAAVADNIEIRDVKQVQIKISKHLNFSLLYDKNKSLDKRIKFEQLIKK